MYGLVKPLLFRFDPERVHDRVMSGLAWCGRHPGALALLRAAYGVDDPRLQVRRFGLVFANPIGLAAGLDKNALALPSWPALGFGSVEIGSVTALAQAGNPKPRLFRLPDDEALINRMGFNNDGAEAVAARLQEVERRGDRPRVPIGVNVGKSKVVPLERAADDYRAALERLWPHADYLVLNVSSPNTPGLRELQERDRLEALLALVAEVGAGAPKPVLLKIAPDLASGPLDELLELAERHALAGIIATNTTLARDGLRHDPHEAGGLSGRPLRERSLAFLRHVRRHSSLPVVSVGGVAEPADVVARLRAGACLVQLYSGFIYGGPGTARRLCRGLLDHLEREGLGSVEELIGLDHG